MTAVERKRENTVAQQRSNDTAQQRSNDTAQQRSNDTAQQRENKVMQLAEWATRDGDPDVLWVCIRALDGDVQMHEEAVDFWWPEWAKRFQAEPAVGVGCEAEGTPLETQVRCAVHARVQCRACLAQALRELPEG